MTIEYCSECDRPRDGSVAGKDKDTRCKVCQARPFEPKDQTLGTRKRKDRKLRLVEGAAR